MVHLHHGFQWFTCTIAFACDVQGVVAPRPSAASGSTSAASPTAASGACQRHGSHSALGVAPRLAVSAASVV
jgi:hypothetical protein